MTDIQPGYKQTEVGVIPEDWDISTLSTLSKEPMQNGVFFKPSLKGVGVKLINVGDLYTRAPIDSDALELFDATEKEQERFKVEDGDLFFTRSSVVPSGIAYCNIYSAQKHETIVFDSHVIRMRPDARKILPSYLFRFCLASAARRYLVSHAKTGSMTTIDQGVLGKCPVSLPPKAEQEAIAEVLSDTDALIESLEQIIAKKRHIKQGAMQELLTGKKRLPGFSGEWGMKRLGDLCEKISTGKLDANAMVEGGEYPFFTCAKEHYRIDKYAFDAEVLLVSGNGANVGYVHYYHGKFNAYQRTYVLSGFRSNIQFIKLFMERNLQERIRVEVNAGNTPYIVMGTLADMLVTLPINLKEQTAIATILSDIDAEIAALETKLAKTRALKQGMMQELLTGKTRLI